jgi:hypothetical protein
MSSALYNDLEKLIKINNKQLPNSGTEFLFNNIIGVTVSPAN